MNAQGTPRFIGLRIGLFRIACWITLLMCLTVFNPIARALVGEASASYHLKHDPVVAYQKTHFVQMCQIYRQSTWVERWTVAENWSNSWCKDYLDRM